jgi:hypothetical protein
MIVVRVELHSAITGREAFVAGLRAAGVEVVEP